MVEEAVKSTLLGLEKSGKSEKKATAVASPGAAPKLEEKAKPAEAIAKPEAQKAEAKEPTKSETPKAKEADPAKEFVDAIMAEMSLKGASKKRLIKTLAEQYNFDKQKVLFKLRRALITERYAAVHAAAEGGGAGGAH